MNTRMCIAATVVGLGLLTGCAENQTRIGEGAGMGGLGGALLGGIVGHQSGNGVAGALIGGAVGAAGGAMVGSQIEKPGQPGGSTYAAAPANAAAISGAMTMQQVVDMSKGGTSSDAIIAQIQSSHATFYLTADDISYLRNNGVSQRVIEAMQSAH